MNNPYPPLKASEACDVEVRAASVFQPRTPISTREFFAGRWEQITTIADSVAQIGLHVVIYGERGVGKTSLANVIRPIICVFDGEKRPERLIVKVVAHGDDTFGSIWRKLFDEITWINNKPAYGFNPGQDEDRVSVNEAFGLHDEITVDHVRRTLSYMNDSVFIIDEFDRCANSSSRQFTDLIKSLSDFSTNCTIVLVGVSDTIDQLIIDHASIGRALVQILLPRMQPKELREILSKAEESLGIVFEEDVTNLIVHMSQGLPHYTHLIGLNSVRIAARRLSRRVERSDVYESLKEAVKHAQQSVTDKFLKATHSSHPDALYRQVLLACALTATKATDQLGYFYPAAVTQPLSRILSRSDLQIATFTNHLAEFCQEKRGPALDRTGQQRSYRYRFTDPLLVPYAFMDAITSGLVTPDGLTDLLSG